MKQGAIVGGVLLLVIGVGRPALAQGSGWHFGTPPVEVKAPAAVPDTPAPKPPAPKPAAPKSAAPESAAPKKSVAASSPAAPRHKPAKPVAPLPVDAAAQPQPRVILVWEVDGEATTVISTFDWIDALPAAEAVPARASATVSAIKPPISSQFNHASGDSARDGMVGIESFAVARLKLNVDAHHLLLATTGDGLYPGQATPKVSNRSAASATGGSAFDIQAAYAFSKELSLGAGVSTLVASDYLPQSTMSGTFWVPYLMWSLRF